jgi:hypothetical protein
MLRRARCNIVEFVARILRVRVSINDHWRYNWPIPTKEEWARREAIASAELEKQGPNNAAQR